MRRLLSDRIRRGGGAHEVRAAALRGGIGVNTNMVVAAALTSVIMLVGFLHAPVIPVIAGAALACAWTFWRANGRG